MNSCLWAGRGFVLLAIHILAYSAPAFMLAIGYHTQLSGMPAPSTPAEQRQGQRSIAHVCWGLASLLLLALILRLTVLLVHTGTHETYTYEHGEIAQNLLAGKGFSVRFLGAEGPTSQQAPGYPILLAGGYSLWGGENDSALLLMQIVQAAIGAALAPLVAWLAWSLLPGQRLLGWMAGMLAALAPPHIYMVTHIQVVTWAAFWLTLLLALCCSARCASRWWGMIGAGAITGIMLLFEPILALVTPLAALSAFRSNRASHPVWPSLARVGAMAAVAWLVVLPWLVRNYRVHGEFVFIKSTFGYAFWQGNNPASWGTDKVPKASAEGMAEQHDGSLAGMDAALWNARHETIYIDDLLPQPGQYKKLRGLSELERSRLLGREAAAFITAEPRAYLRLCGQRLKYFLLGDETNPKSQHWLFRLCNGSWLAMFVAGLVLLRKEWKPLLPVLGVFVIVMLFHTLTITSMRFRIPVEPLTLVWCAAPLTAIATAIRRRLSKHDPSAERWSNEWSRLVATPPADQPQSAVPLSDRMENVAPPV